MIKTNVLNDAAEILKEKNTKKNETKECRFSNKKRVIKEDNSEENNEEEFNRNLKKINQSNNISEIHKLSQFTINYYEWDEIPPINNLPYGLINKKNDYNLKNYNENANLNLNDENTCLYNNNQTKNLEYDKWNTFNKQTILNATSSNSLNNDYKNNIDENMKEQKHTNVYEGKNFHYFASSTIYEDIKEYFLKIKPKVTNMNSTYVTSENGDKKDAINSENNSVSIKKETEIIIKKEDALFEKENNNIKSKNNIESKSQTKSESELENKNDTKKKMEEENNTIIENKKEKKNENENENEKKNKNVIMNKERITWVNDFIALTNIQILAKNTNKFNEWDNLKVIIPNIISFCCSPRSCICKNSFLTIKYLCTSLKQDKINLCKFFVSIFPFIIKKLDIKNNFLNKCATESIEEFMVHSNSVNNYEMLRLICSHSKNKNASISKKMSYFVYLFLKNLPKKDLINFNVSDFADPFLNFINAKLEETKKYIKQTFTVLLEFHNENSIIENFKNALKHKEIIIIIERQIRNLLKCNNCESSKKKYTTFHEFKNTYKLRNLDKNSSFIF